MAAHQVTHSGLDTLLTPEESVLVLVDHQAFQFANMHSHEPQLVVGNTVALAKTARTFGVPTILTTVNEDSAVTFSREFKTCSPTRSRSTAHLSTLGKTQGSLRLW